MDALEFLLNAQRYCNSDSKAIDKLKGFYLEKDRTKLDFEIMIAEAEKWAKEHPIKTRQSEFLKMFPNAFVEDGVLSIPPCNVDRTVKGSCAKKTCSDCHREFWLKVVE